MKRFPIRLPVKYVGAGEVNSEWLGQVLCGLSFDYGCAIQDLEKIKEKLQSCERCFNCK